MKRFVGMLVLVVGLGVGLAGEAVAQGSSSAPDVVETVDGAVVRGTILERTPDGAVTIEDFRGNIREFAADEIEYAGAADRDGVAPVAAPTQVAQPETITLRFVPDVPRLALERRRGASGAQVETEDVCVGTCEAQLAPGQHTFYVVSTRPYLTRPSVRTRPNTFTLSEDTLLSVESTERRTHRAILIAGGTALMVAGGLIVGLASDYGDRDPETDSYHPADAAFAGGITMVLGGLVAVMVGSFLQNTARLSTSPLER